MKLREKLLAHRLWYTMLNNKLQREMSKAVNIESAFRKVKAATGLSDAHEIVERFLTRE
jgi:hypothetical protein